MEWKIFITSPNPQFQTPIAIISFVVYAIFAYGGMESLGSVTDSMDKPEKTFPRGLIIASLFTIGAYVIMIFMIGFSVNYNSVVAKHGVNLGNITYIVFSQLGVYLGHSLGWSAAASSYNRYVNYKICSFDTSSRIFRCNVHPLILTNQVIYFRFR